MLQKLLLVKKPFRSRPRQCEMLLETCKLTFFQRYSPSDKRYSLKNTWREIWPQSVSDLPISKLEFKFDKEATFFKNEYTSKFSFCSPLRKLELYKKCIPAPMVKGSEVTLKTSESSFTAFSEMYAS